MTLTIINILNSSNYKFYYYFKT